jgi:hypothetical protein
MFRSHYVVLFSMVLALAVCASSPNAIPPPSNFRHDHYAYTEFEQFLARNASRGEVLRKLRTVSRKVHVIDGKAQFLAITHEVSPSRRALILLEHWPRALFTGLIDDVRLLACFDSHDRLVAYELF